jgi:phosphatidate cytidylyltransferase
LSNPPANPPSSSARPSDLIPRLLVAAVGIPLLFGVAFLAPNAALWLVLTSAAGIGGWEYFRMTLGAPLRGDAWLCVAGIVLVMSAGYWGLPATVVHASAALVTVAALTACMRSSVETAAVAARFGHLMAGFVYCALLFGALLALVRGPDPLLHSPTQAGWLLWPMMIIWAGDTGAYFAGRAFGRRKLAPRLSPAKTVEGAIGGLFASLAGGFLGWVVLPLPETMEPWHVVLFALPGAIIGQVGDLAESLLKRSTGVKDSSRILSGHGGMLDRVDALVFAAPYFALLKAILQFT